MAYKNLMDLHTHTDNSPDGHHSVMLMCEKASENGLRAIAITDHCECNAYQSEGYAMSSRQSIFEASKARSVYTGQLIVLVGIELGQPMQDLSAARSAVNQNVDFVVGSVHNLSGMKDFYYLDFSLPENDPELLFDRYLDEITDMVSWGGFDSLAHLTYPLRYITGAKKKPLDVTKYYAKIDRIFRLLAATGKSLEINTSGLRQELGMTMPDEELIKRYRAAGGEYITIGSDAHYAKDVGAGVAEAMDMAKRAGFEHLTLYQSRIPIQVPLL